MIGFGPLLESVKPMRNPASGRIETLRKKLQDDPGSKLFIQLAEEYRKNGEFEDALAVCLKGLEENPCYHSARASLGRLYLEMGKPEEAIKELQRVLHEVPDNLLAKRLLDGIRSSSDPVKSPRASEGKRMARNGQDPTQTETLAEIYLKQGHRDKAIGVYEEILKNQPGNRAAKDRLGKLRGQSSGSLDLVPACPEPEDVRRRITALQGWLDRIHRE